MKKNAKIISLYRNHIFILVNTVVILFFVTTIFYNQQEIMYSENRSAYKVPTFSLGKFFEGSFQSDLELSLSDQIYKSETIKLKIKQFENNLYLKALKVISFNTRETYVPFKENLYFLNNSDYLVYKPYEIEEIENKLIDKLTIYNELYKEYPELDFYMYFIERDANHNFDDELYDEKIYKIVENNLLFENYSRFTFTSSNYEEIYSKTDHHWNVDGSYIGYTEILNLLEITENPRDFEKICFNFSFNGSKAAKVAYYDIYDEFCTYKYDLGNYETLINGELVHNGLANNELYKIDGQESKLSINKPNPYNYVYGYNKAEIVYTFDYDPSKDNILIFSDSFSLPIDEALASHFNKLYNIDLRYHDTFDFNEYIEDKKISKVLFVGNMGMYIDSSFNNISTGKE